MAQRKTLIGLAAAFAAGLIAGPAIAQEATFHPGDDNHDGYVDVQEWNEYQEEIAQEETRPMEQR